MLVIDAKARAQCLNFPNAHTVLLHDEALEGKCAPLVLCLHDLGYDREEFKSQARLAVLTERYAVALTMPDGRRSCFLNMAHGPRWNDYLSRDLLPLLCRTFPVNGDRVGVIGLGTGALGALQLARQGLPCVLIEPEVGDAVEYHSSRWPSETEWRGVFEGRGADWQPQLWKDVTGAMVGGEASLAHTAVQLGLHHWAKIDLAIDLEAQLNAALAHLMNFL